MLLVPRPDLLAAAPPIPLRKGRTERRRSQRISPLLPSRVMVVHVPDGIGRSFRLRMRALRIVFRRGGIELPSMCIALRFLVAGPKLLVVGVGDSRLLADLLDHILVERGIAAGRRLLTARLGD